jgi:hypothetical protein
MGATKKQTSNANYYKIDSGNFTKNVSTKTEDSREREFNGKVYFYETYTQLSGKLAFIFRNTMENKTQTKEWEEVSFKLVDEENEVSILTMYFGSRESEQILNRLLNCDLSKELFISVFKNEKENNILLIKQKNEKGELIKIENHFTKDKTESETFGTYPKLEIKKVKGKEIYDNSERCDFWDKIINFINEALKQHNEAAQ